MKIFKFLTILLILVFSLSINAWAAGKYISMNLEYDGGTHYYNAEEIKLCINNRELTDLTMPPIIFNSYSLVPAREVFESFGADVEWLSDTYQVRITHESTNVLLTINSNVAYVNGETAALDIPAKIINNKTMIPLRFVAEAINKEVQWDNDTRTANICDIPVTTSTEATTEAATEATTTEATTVAAININSVKVESGNTADVVVINATGKASVSTVLSQKKDLLTIDIENATLIGDRGDIEKGTYFNGGFYYQLKEGFVRVSLEVYSDIGYNVSIEDNAVKITFSPAMAADTDNTDTIDHDSSNSGTAVLSSNVKYEKHRLIINDANNIINVNNITHSDKYTEKEYMLTFNTSLANLVSNGTTSIGDDLINSITVASYGTYSSITFNTARIVAVDIQKSGSQVIIQFLLPKEKYDKIIVLDAGHGGTDRGASGNDLIEKDLNLDILQRAVRLFDEDGEIKAYATRESDVYPSFDDRTNLGNEVGDAFISIHINSAESTDASGTETFCLYPNDTGSGLTSYTLAETLLNNLLEQLGTKNRGVKSDNLIVLRQSEIPASLIEIGFISNYEEATYILGSETYRQKAAQAIFDSVKELFNTYTPIR